MKAARTSPCSGNGKEFLKKVWMLAPSPLTSIFFRPSQNSQGVDLPKKMQELDGRSLLPLLEDPDADWAHRELFVHCGRWNAGQREDNKYTKCAVRTPNWRFVNNSELYHIPKDPGETNDVAAEHPKVVNRLRKSLRCVVGLRRSLDGQ